MRGRTFKSQAFSKKITGHCNENHGNSGLMSTIFLYLDNTKEAPIENESCIIRSLIHPRQLSALESP